MRGGGYSKRISLNKNPNVNKKMWGGGECGGGADIYISFRFGLFIKQIHLH